MPYVEEAIGEHCHNHRQSEQHANTDTTGGYDRNNLRHGIRMLEQLSCLLIVELPNQY